MKLSPKKRREVVARYRRGEHNADIARDLSVSPSRVTQVAHEAGLDKQHPIGRYPPPSQAGVPPGHRRLASGKVIRYAPPRRDGG